MFDVFIVTFFTPAGLFTLVFYRKGLPVVDVTQSIEIISKCLAVDAKIRGDHDEPHDPDQDECPNKYPERSQDVAFHNRLVLLCRSIVF